MSVESISKVLNADLDCTPTQKLILVGIANHDGDGGAWPSVKTLARYAGIKERAVQYALTELEKKGYIVRHLNQGGTARTKDHSRPNLYELQIAPGAAHCTPPVQPTAPQGVQPTAPEPSLNTSIEPSTPHSPPTGEVEVVPEWEVFFNHFWEAYPRKVGKPAARRAMKSRYEPITRRYIIDGTRAWVQHWMDTRTDEQFIPHPSTFLNQERYNDAPPEVSAPKLSKAEEAIERIRNRDQ